MNSKVLLFGGLSTATFSLGIWQVQRYFWKVDLIKSNNELFNLPVEKIQDINSNPELISKFQSLKGRKISVEGEYDYTKEILLGPRSAPGLISEKAQGMATNPQGFYVITPLYLNNGKRIFVNRGWIPLNCKQWSCPTGNVETTGIIKEFENKALFTPNNDLKTNRFIWLSRQDLLKIFSNSNNSETDEDLPVFLERLDDQKVSLESDNLPLAKQKNQIDSNYVTPEVHFAYAFTWFSLSIISMIILRKINKSKNRAILRQQQK